MGLNLNLDRNLDLNLINSVGTIVNAMIFQLSGDNYLTPHALKTRTEQCNF